MQSQNCHSKGQKILPIFNVRKRPRQALYAVPSTLSQEAEKKPSSHSQPHHSAPLQQVFQAEGDWNIGKSSNPFQNQKGPSCQQSVFSNTGKSAFQKYVGANETGTSNRKIQPAKLLKNSQLKTTSAGSYPTPSKNYNQTTPVGMNSSMSTANCMLPSTSNFPQSLSNKSIAPQMKTSNSPRSVQQPVPKQAKSTMNDRRLGEDFKKTNKSMRVLTVGIEGVRKWSQILAVDEMLMYEVFARMSSAVLSNEGNNAKLFTLQDGNHTLHCIFYETDRRLPQVQKGQIVRCLGSFRVIENIFHCVTIRIVSPTEQHWMKAQISACDKALRSELAVAKMEP